MKIYFKQVIVGSWIVCQVETALAGRDFTRSWQSYFPESGQVFDNNEALIMGKEQELWTGWCRNKSDQAFLEGRHSAALGVYPIYKKNWDGSTKYVHTSFAIAPGSDAKRFSKFDKPGDQELGETKWSIAKEYWYSIRSLQNAEIQSKQTAQGEWIWNLSNNTGEQFKYSLKSFATSESNFKLSRLYLTAKHDNKDLPDYDCVFVKKYGPFEFEPHDFQ